MSVKRIVGRLLIGLVAASVVGAAMRAVAGLLLAPRSGGATRDQLARPTGGLRHRIAEGLPPGKPDETNGVISS